VGTAVSITFIARARNEFQSEIDIYNTNTYKVMKTAVPAVPAVPHFYLSPSQTAYNNSNLKFVASLELRLLNEQSWAAVGIALLLL
jgi:hypothetical protein